MDSYTWDNCYQASDGNVIGHTIGSLGPNDFWGTTANWNYDYNNYITFIHQTSRWQKWGWRNHQTSRCWSTMNNCPCGGTNSCNGNHCSDWRTCCHTCS